VSDPFRRAENTFERVGVGGNHGLSARAGCAPAVPFRQRRLLRHLLPWHRIAVVSPEPQGGAHLGGVSGSPRGRHVEVRVQLPIAFWAGSSTAGRSAADILSPSPRRSRRAGPPWNRSSDRARPWTSAVWSARPGRSSARIPYRASAAGHHEGSWGVLVRFDVTSH
jgi:hypothetical protein